MRRFIFLFLILASLSCSTSQKRIENIRQPSSLSFGFSDLGRVLKEGVKTFEAQQCLRDICGSENENFYQTAAETNQAERHIYKPGTDLYQKIDALLNVHLDYDQPSFSEEIELVEWALGLPDIKLNRYSKRMFNSSFLINNYFIVLSRKDFVSNSQFQNYVLDSSDLDELNLTSAEKEFMIQARDRGYFKQALNYLLYDRQNGAYFLETHFPGVPHEEAIPQALERCAGSARNFAKKMNVEVTYLGSDYCRKLLEQGEIQALDSDRLSEELFSASFREFLIADEFKDLLESEQVINFNRDLKEYSNSELFSKKRGLAKTDFSKHPKRKEVLNQCHKIIGDYLEVSTSPLRQRIARETLDRFKNETLKLIHFDDPQKQTEFSERLQKARFTLPPDRKTAASRLMRRLKEESKPKPHISKRVLNNEGLISILSFYLANRHDYGLDENGDPKDLFRKTKSLCDSYVKPALSDHIYTASGTSYISWFTTYHLKHGQGILAHELGHYVARILRELGNTSELWLERNQCVAKFHDSPKTEEDWADRFAAKLLKQINSDSGRSNFACALLSTNESGKYAVRFENDPLVNHSNHLFRVLHVEKVLKGHLPRRCEQFVSADLTCSQTK